MGEVKPTKETTMDVSTNVGTQGEKTGTVARNLKNAE